MPPRSLHPRLRLAGLVLAGVVFAAGLGTAAHVIARDTVGLSPRLEFEEPLAPPEASTERTTTIEARTTTIETKATTTVEFNGDTTPATTTTAETEDGRSEGSGSSNSGSGSSGSGEGESGGDNGGGQGRGRGRGRGGDRDD